MYVRPIGFWGGRSQSEMQMTELRRDVSKRFTRNTKSPFDPAAFLATEGVGKSFVEYPDGSKLFSQGDAATAFFFIKKGRVKLSIVSAQGKEAVIALPSGGDFFGEDCLSHHGMRTASATAISDVFALRIEQEVMLRTLDEEPAFSRMMVSYLMRRTLHLEEDLADRLLNSSEKRLARVLLLLANFGTGRKPEPILPKISQETLAQIVGTTRSRVSYFMNKFRRLGYIDYEQDLEVHASLVSVLRQN